MSIRVLVVEDEADISGIIRRTLERDGMHVEVVERGDTAVQSVITDVPDLVLLDINLPGVNGFDVCRILRARPATARVPIIMLTARTAETDRVSGLELGADDYITKPFSLRELLARLKAVLRRTAADTASSEPTTYRTGRLVADFAAFVVSVDGNPVRPTRTEFDLLRCLVEHRNRVLSRDRLLDCVWGDDSTVGARSVDVHIGRLRAKLGEVGSQIETVVGLGYRFVDSTQEAGAA